MFQSVSYYGKAAANSRFYEVRDSRFVPEKFLLSGAAKAATCRAVAIILFYERQNLSGEIPGALAKFLLQEENTILPGQLASEIRRYYSDAVDYTRYSSLVSEALDALLP